jgi:ADP-ribosylglycohydrolase/predicted protein tyrosine phosphatase
MTTTYDRAQRLTGPQLDRAAGVLLATACGDALGAGYEFGPPLPDQTPVGMVGGGPFGWAPGEWTDDTSMAIPIARIAATGADLRSTEAQDQIAAQWAEWANEAVDVGNQTRAVLWAARSNPTGATLTVAATAHHQATGRSAGNGALMRTAPIALAYLHDPAGLDQAAHQIAALTHHDPEAGEACALWCQAIRHAVLHGTLDGLRDAVDALPADRAGVWQDRLEQAENRPPAHFTNNEWVVAALQGAWSAIVRTPTPDQDPAAGVFPAQHLQNALEAAVRGGHDTDTVAAIAGGLLGAVWGASAVPLAWQRRLHGWPSLRARDLIRLGLLTATGGQPDSAGWPAAPVFDYADYGAIHTLAAHPHDLGIHLGGVGILDQLPEDVDAVVSLCRLGADQVPAPGVAAGDHVEVWLIDRDDSGANPHLAHVLHQAATTVAELRAEGRTVLLHCVQAQSRTPAVAAMYAMLTRGLAADQALADVRRALPGAHPNDSFVAALHELDPVRQLERRNAGRGPSLQRHQGSPKGAGPELGPLQGAVTVPPLAPDRADPRGVPGRRLNGNGGSGT